MIELQKEKIKQEKKKDSICEKHNRPLTTFCDNEKCQVVLCEICMLREHRDHKIVEIDKKAEQIVRILLKRKENIDAIRADYVTHTQSMREIADEINAETSKTLDAIDNAREILLDQVMKNTEKLKNDTIQMQQKNLKAIKATCTDFREIKEMHQEAGIFIEKVINNSSPYDLVIKKSEIEKEVNDMIDKVKPGRDWLNSYSLPSFNVKDHDDFMSEVVGKLEEEKKGAPLPENVGKMLKAEYDAEVLRGMKPVEAKLSHSWEGSVSGGIACSPTGTIFAFSGKTVKSYDIDGTERMSVNVDVQGIGGICCVKVDDTNLFVLSCTNTIQLRHGETGALLDSMNLGNFSPHPGICDKDYKTVLFSGSLYQGKVKEIEIRNMKLYLNDKLLSCAQNGGSYPRGITCIKQNGEHIVACAAGGGRLNAYPYERDQFIWGHNGQQFVNKRLYSYGICSDRSKHIFTADCSNNRIVLLGIDGKLISELITTDFRCYYIAWVPGERKLLVVDSDKNTVHVYDVKYFKYEQP